MNSQTETSKDVTNLFSDTKTHNGVFNPDHYLQQQVLLLFVFFLLTAFTNVVMAGTRNTNSGSTGNHYTAANEFYVSPTGKPTGDGSLNNPWDLQTALNQPSSVQAGATIWLRGGTYKGTYISKLTGTVSSPILVKAVAGERAIIDGSRAGQVVKNVTTLQLSGGYTYFSDFEVTNSDPERVISQSGSNPQERRGEGVYVLGPGIKVINLVIYDTGEGLSTWSSAINSEYYGNVIFNNGWFAPDREHGHGIYSQNNTGTKIFSDNIVLNNFSHGWQFYGSANASLKNFYLEGNVMLNDRWLIGGSTPAENIDVNANYTYKDTIEFGYTNNVTNSGLTLRNNVFSSSVLLSFWRNVTATNNRFYNGASYGFPITLMFNGAPDVSTFNFSNNTYYWSNPPSPYQPELAINWVNFPLADSDPNRRGNFFLTQWKSMGKDVNSTIKYFPLIDDRNYAISGNTVYVRKNKYDAKRAHIIIYNYDKLDNVAVDVAGILTAGDNYELHNVQNYFGDVIKGTYNGGQLSVPMNNHTVAKPLGYNYELGKNTQKEFGTFVLIKTTASGTPVTPTNIAPDAIAGNDVSIQLPTNSTALNAGQSVDRDGSIASYNWSKISGPTEPTFSSTTTSAITVSNLVQGTYTFRATVTDNKGATASDDVIVTVNAATSANNQAPVARAGNDVTLQLPVNYTTLNAGGSTDPDGNIATYNWTKIAGPAQYAAPSPSSAVNNISDLAVGTYTFRLTVTDTKGLSSDDDINITVLAAGTTANQPPVANAGADQRIQLPVNSVTLNASASSDADGKLVSYNWTKVTGPSSFTFSSTTSASSVLSNLTAGNYILRLTVTDDKGATATDDVNVDVTAAPTTSMPVANAGKDETIPVGQATVLHGETSTAAAGIKSYVWSKLSGPASVELLTPSANTTWIRNMTAGTYVFRLAVMDNNGNSSTDDVAITVTAAATAPTEPITGISVNAGDDVNMLVSAGIVYFRATTTVASDRYISGYKWTKIAGPSQFFINSTNTANTSVSYLVAGIYTFRITVSDNKGNSVSDDVSVTVTTAPLSASVAGAGSIEESNGVNGKQVIQTYPNPVSNNMQLNWNSSFTGNAIINIVDVNGKSVKKISIRKENRIYNNTIDLSALEQGLYILEIKGNDGSAFSSKFIKK